VGIYGDDRRPVATAIVTNDAVLGPFAEGDRCTEVAR
jgi:hypothetical protein